MKIIDNYDYQGFFTKKVFWRVFGAWDGTYAFGLKEGLLERGESTDYQDSDFFQIEFKKANVLGEILVAAGPIYSRHCGDIALGTQGNSVSQSVPPWSLPKGQFTEWMNNEKIQHKTLFEITLPYTHDSGAYRLGPRLYHDSKSSGLPQVLADAFAVTKSLHLELADAFEQLVRSVCQAQSRPIDQQLNEGIRGLDLRVVTINGAFNTGHGMVGETITYILAKVKQFLEETRRELVVVMVGVGDTTDNNARNRLAELIRNTFQDRLVPTTVDLKATRIGDITREKSRVIVTGPGFRSEADLGYVGTEWWVNTDDPKVLVDENVKRVKAHQAPGVWANPGWTLTPQINPILDRAGEIAKDIVAHAADIPRVVEDLKSLIALFQKFQDSSILNLSRKANPLLKGVINTQLANDRINAISVDFYEESAAVELAITRSARDVVAGV